MVGASFAAPTDDITYGDDGADQVWIDVNTLTVAKHPMSEGGTHEDMAGYENDSGDWVDDPAFVVNTSIGEDVASDEEGNRNMYTYNPAYLESDQFGAFPRVGDDEDDESTDDPASEDNLASALDASEWSNVHNASESSISDTTIASNVDAVKIDTGSSMVAGDNTSYQYNNWTSELDSDETKRVIQLAGNVDDLDSSTVVDVNVTDESGDWVNVEINGSSSASTSDIDVAATSTGTFFYQEKISDLTVHGGGSFDNIESIEVNVRDGDADVQFSWIDLESKGKDTFGEKIVDDDDDDDDFDNTEEQYNGTGTISISDMTTLDSKWDDAEITDVQFPAKFRAQDLKTEGDDEDYRVEWTNSTKYTQENVLTVEYRLELPAEVDLSYAGTSLEMTQTWPDSRYVELGTIEGSDGEKFSTHEDDDDYTDQTSSLGTEDSDIELDGSITTDTEYVVKIVSTFTDSEKATITDTGSEDTTTDDSTDDAGGGTLGGGDSGGIIGTIWSWISTPIGMIVSGLAVVGSWRAGLFKRLRGG